MLRGAVISSQSLVMLVLIPVVGALADRVGAQRLVVLGTVLGIGGNLGFYLSGLLPQPVIGLFIASALMAGMWSTIGGLGVAVVGIPTVFVLPAVLTAVACVGLAVQLMVGRRRLG